MAHKPRCFVANAEFTLKLLCADTFFAAAHLMDCEKPLCERDMAVLKDSADANRELLPASVTLPQPQNRLPLRMLSAGFGPWGREPIDAIRIAVRANGPARPHDCLDHPKSLGFIGNDCGELGEVHGV